MEYMFESGFLGTRAPFFMDLVSLIVAMLPILIYGAIMLARKKMYRTHMIVQNIIFVLALIVITYFEVGVRIVGGFNSFMEGSSVPYNFALTVLVIHIIIAIVMLFYWSITIYNGNINFKKKVLPGVESESHKVMARKSVLAIIFTAFSGLLVYLILFVF